MAKDKVGLTDSEKQQLLQDLKACESIAEDIENAKKAGIPGIEMLEERYNTCINDLRNKHAVYGKRGA